MGKEEAGQSGVGLPIGSKIGKYVIREKLGSGGQAIVYKCYDEMLDRNVAIKQISTKLAEDSRFLERFRKEAKILAHLGAEQPSIISIYELIEDPNGLFIVMEFAEGHSLESLLNTARGPMEPKAVLQIVWRLAAGLHAVHQAGIIHRDIKPSNIIIGEERRVKITDFGVAAGAAEQTSMLLGTTKYMAPEVFEGEKFDNRADMYSLGFVAYEMMVGRPAFNEVFADILRDKHSEAVRWMKWHGKRKVAAPPAVEVNPDVPRKLSEIVAKMMAKDPDDRFESMEILARTLKMAFSPQRSNPVEASGQRPGSTPVSGRDGAGSSDEADDLDISPEAPATAPLPKRRSSLRTKLIITGFVAVGFIAIGIFLGVQEAQREQERRRGASNLYGEGITAYRSADYAMAVASFEQVKREFPATTQALRASVMEHMGRARKAVQDRDWALAQSAEDDARYHAEQVQASKESLKKWTREILDEITSFSAERVDTRGFVEALDTAKSALEDGRYELARTALNRGLSRINLTELQKAEVSKFRSEVDLKEFIDLVESAFAEGKAFDEKGEFTQAIDAYNRARQKLDSVDAEIMSELERGKLTAHVTAALREARKSLAHQQAMTLVADAKARNDRDAELKALETAVKLRSSKESEARIRQLRSAIALDQARALLAKGEVDQARAAFEEALKNDPNNTAAAVELKQLDQTAKWQGIVRSADADLEAGEYPEALKKFTLAAEIRPDGDVTAKMATCRFFIGLAAADKLRDAKQYDKALAAYEELRQVKPEEAAKVIDARQTDVRQRKNYDKAIAMGDMAVVSKRWAEALKHYRTAKDIRPGEEVDQRIAGARYAEYLVKGKASMETDDLTSARAYFKTAKRYMDTQEVNDLIEEVDHRLEERD